MFSIVFFLRLQLRSCENVMNKFVKYKILLISLIIISFGFQSCYKDKFDFSNLNDSIQLSPNIGVPIAYGELSFRDMVKEKKDTIEYYTEGTDKDELVRFIYNIDTISKFKASEFLKPPLMEPITKSVKLGVLTIDNQAADATIAFDKFVKENLSLNDYNYYNNLGPNGNAVIKTGIGASSYPLDFFGTIGWVYTLSGDVVITLTNNYNVPLSCKLILQTDLHMIGVVPPIQTVGTFDFTKKPIPPGGSATDTVKLNAFKISNILSYKFSNITLGAKNPVTIDMSKTLGIGVELAKLKVKSGKAAIPAQSINKDTVMWFTVDTYKGKKLTRLDVYKGVLNFNVSSMIPGMNVTLTLPNVKDMKTGKTVSSTFVFTDAAPSITKSWDLSGYSMELDHNPKQPYNSLQVALKFAVNSAGQQISFNETNDFTIKITNPDSIKFEYVEGNLGHDTIDVGKKSFDFNLEQYVSNYISGEIKFTDPKLSLIVDNSIGISASTDIQLTAKNKDKKELALFPSYNDFHAIACPSELSGNFGDTVVSSITANKDSSNIVDFLAMIPNSITADGKFYTNYGIADKDVKNYIKRESFIGAKLHAELPLKLSLKDFVLRQDIDLKADDFKVIDSLNNDDYFKIIFYAKNQFPLGATVKLMLYDTLQNKVLDTLAITALTAAPAGSNGKVPSSTYTRKREEIIVSKDKNPRIVQNLKKANRLRIEAKLNSYNQKSITIYSYYSIAFQIGVQAKMNFKTKLSK